MRLLVAVLAVMASAGVAQAQIPVDGVTYESEDQAAAIATITVGGFTVDAGELVNGISDTDTDVDDLVPTTGAFGNAGGLGDIVDEGITTVFDDLAIFGQGGLVDTNGAGNPDIFIFESSGQDTPDIWATYSDGGGQVEGAHVTVDGWGDAGADRGVDGGQDGAAIALNISDLTGGSNTATIHALHIADDGSVDLTVIAVHVIPCPVVTTHSDGGSVVAETGETTDSFTVHLFQTPTAEVTLTVDPSTTDISLDGEAPNNPITLTFTTADWNVPQTVTVKANDDGSVDGHQNVPINYTSASTDPDFACDSGTGVLVVDNESAHIAIEETGGSTSPVEGGATDTYSVSMDLGRAPTSDVVITITEADPAVGEVDPNQVTVNGAGAGGAATLTFTSANWQASQTVTVAAIDDSEQEAEPHAATLAHAVSSSDAGFDGLALSSVAVSVGENDCGAGPFDSADFNADCMVDLTDFAFIAARLLDCSILVCN